MRNSTDAVWMSSVGYPTVCFSSINSYRALSNYHQMSYTPESLVYETVVPVVTAAETVVRELAQ